VKEQTQSFGVVGSRASGEHEGDGRSSSSPKHNPLSEPSPGVADIGPGTRAETPLEEAYREFLETNTANAEKWIEAQVKWLDAQSDRVREETRQSRIFFALSMILAVPLITCLVLGFAANSAFLTGSWISSPALAAAIVGGFVTRPRREG
jgi:hypothetical protein